VDWWSVAGIVLGLVGGGFLNWWFSRRTSREVRLILRGLAEMAAGREVEFRRNAKGEIVGFHFKRTIMDTVSTSDSVDIHLEIHRREDEDTDAPPEQEKPGSPRPD
jgi:hypothetical protein